MDSGDEGLSKDLLERTLENLRTRLDEKRAEIAALQEDFRRIEREAQLIEELLRVRDRGVERPHEGERIATIPPASNENLVLTSAVLDILNIAGKPLHIQELLSRVRDRRVTIPGKGEAANLIAHIRANPQVVRPARGMYGLRSWGLEDYADSRVGGDTTRRTPARRRRRMKRGRSTIHARSGA